MSFFSHMAKREWKRHAENNADMSWKEAMASYCFSYFGLMSDWELVVARRRTTASSTHRYSGIGHLLASYSVIGRKFLEVIDFVCNIFIIFATNISCYP